MLHLGGSRDTLYGSGSDRLRKIYNAFPEKFVRMVLQGTCSRLIRLPLSPVLSGLAAHKAGRPPWAA